MSWWNPVDWVDAVEDVAEDLEEATVAVATGVADELVDVGNTLVKTGHTIYTDVADGAVAAFNTASGGVIYAVDWTETETSKVATCALSTCGDIAHFSVDLYGKTVSFAEDAYKYLSSYLMSSPPSLGPYNDLARDFMKALFTVYLASESSAESVVSSWERDARKKGYTMAIDFDGGIQLVSITADIVAGVYVDSKGEWGFLVNVGVSVSIVPSVEASITMDLYMLFGGVSMYNDKSYYFIGGTFDIEGFIIGGDVLLSSGFAFKGFRAALGVGVSYDLFASGGSESAKSTSAESTSVEASPSLPSLDIYSVNLLGEQGATHDVACQVATDSSQETSIVANASGAMTMKSASILASDQVGGSGGSAFADDITNVARIKSITLRGGTYVSAISITYVLHDGSTVVKSHGGTSGTAVTLNLIEDEYITKVTGRSGSLLDQVCFTTSHGRTLSTGGGGGGPFTIDPKLNRPIIGIFGSSGSDIDAFGVYYRSGVPFTLQSRNSNLYLDVVGQMDASDGASAVQQSSTGGPHQHWLLSPGGDEGEYCIVNEHSGLSLEASGSSVGASVVQNAASGSDTQVWSFTESGGYCLIKNKGTGMYLDVQGISFTAGAQVYQWSLTSGLNQQWRLAPVAAKVYAFSGGGFTGSFQAFGPGSYDLSQITLGNDTIRSLQVPEGWRVTLHQHAGFAGTTQEVTRDASELGSMSAQASSLVVEMPPWGVTLYKDASYKGSSRTLSPGRYASLSGLGFSKNTLSSVTIPSGWRVTLFDHENFEGEASVLTSDTASLGSFNDETSSLVVEAAPLGQVVLYKDYRYAGTSQVLTPGRQDMSALTASGAIGDNRLSSVKVPTNWTVILYKDSGYSGTSKTLTADCSRLDDFNDTTSSLIVIPG
ncbi:RICIN domain-containing protein [Chondromyces apiculatus]|uniref:Glucan endo-1,6-beta-glucosidase n=1 Tax=Chondromyces apiculatus DSM 436 TaxID=1192034 RepID=A0A017T981_9BACT|nr:RICIN domain-containing protein [Chondromyces apiculatus]EYF05151.1 Glucan endo-1,6-beta-glucosidase [Chondromyces apiculatus DSM 436]